jgi:hypothetical protein
VPAFTLLSEKLQLLVFPEELVKLQLPRLVLPFASRVTVPVGFRAPEFGVTVTVPVIATP